MMLSYNYILLRNYYSFLSGMSTALIVQNKYAHYVEILSSIIKSWPVHGEIGHSIYLCIVVVFKFYQGHS